MFCRDYKHFDGMVQRCVQDPVTWRLWTLGPGTPLKFKSGTPEPPSKFENGTLGLPSKFKSTTPGTSPFFHEFIFFFQNILYFSYLKFFFFLK